jgi:hypothetical protein
VCLPRVAARAGLLSQLSTNLHLTLKWKAHLEFGFPISYTINCRAFAPSKPHQGINENNSWIETYNHQHLVSFGGVILPTGHFSSTHHSSFTIHHSIPTQYCLPYRIEQKRILARQTFVGVGNKITRPLDASVSARFQDSTSGMINSTQSYTMSQSAPSDILKILLPFTVIGWLNMGLICILSINGSSGRGGWWKPEWYLDTQHTRKDRMCL